MLSNNAIQYVYSYVHLQELQELKDIDETKRNKRLQTIEKLTFNRLVCNDDNHQLVLYKFRPFDIIASFENPLMKILSQQIHGAASDWVVDEKPNFLMSKLGIEKKVINNYTPKMLVEEYGHIIQSYISLTCSFRQEVFQSLFNILDALGYWQDKVKSGSSLNRLYDANHAYFATSCDYFVTDDKNTRNKANVAYELYNYKTKAVSYEELTSIIKD